MQSSVNTAIVLCAGRGKRLSPHTDTTPKPLLPVDQISAYAQQQSYFPVESIRCVRQQQIVGTADATVAALEALPSWFTGSFLLTASDYLVPLTFYKSLLEAHQQSDKEIAVSLKRIAGSELSMRSSARFDSRGDVVEIVEKPKPGTAPSQLSANLVFVLPADIVASIVEVKPSPRGEKEIQSAVNSYLQHNGPGFSLEQIAPEEWHPDMC